ncbi:MAG: penicillin acylase family protein, partial [Bdellovibrionales bacterium]
QHTGFLSKRDVGSGRFVMDGRVATSGLEKGLSDDELPRSLDPAAGFVLSANQRAVDERFPHYLGWDWEEPFRAMSIRRRLRGKDKFSPEDMIRIQNDASDLQAELILPHLLKNIQEERLTLPQKSWVERLSAWDFVDRASSVEPSLFKAWFRQLKEELFNDDYQVQAKHFYPKDLRVLWLLERVERDPKDSDAAWVDNRKTESVESAPDLITRAFQRAWERLEAKHGSNPEEWTWAVYNSTQLPHIARLPGFGSQVLSMDGSGESIRGQKGQHGAVYKIVVALGEWPRAWIQVPGGNEGDPFSPRFGQDVEAWSRGDMRPAEFYKNLSEARAKAVRVVEFQPHSVAGKR